MIRLLLNAISNISRVSGKIASWFTTILVILIVCDVFMRYFLNHSFAWIIELEWHLFALIFLLGAAYTLQNDAHVRVDLFYSKFSESRKAWINLIGVLLFLAPWCLIVIRAAYKYAYNSYKIGETSPDPGGLPALWILKFMIVISFVLLLLEASSLFIRSLLVILNRTKSIFPKSESN